MLDHYVVRTTRNFEFHSVCSVKVAHMTDSVDLALGMPFTLPQALHHRFHFVCGCLCVRVAVHFMT